MEGNVLYYGDNLGVLKQHIKDESVDLVYLDPPFSSDKDYNMLFKEKSGKQAASQVKAFSDTWHWDKAAALTYQQIIEKGGKVSEAMWAFHVLLGDSDMMAYLVMMTPRLVELRRVLKPTGSIYLHCDTTASHYLKILLDAVFGPVNFKNEIIWKRTSAHNDPKKYGRIHDVLLYYSKSENKTWNVQYTAYSEEHRDSSYGHRDSSGRPYCLSDLTGPGVTNGPSGMPWRGIDPTTKGRCWSIPRCAGDIVAGKSGPEALEALEAAGRVAWPKKAGGVPRYIRYLDEMPGVPLQDIWGDLPPLSGHAREKLGYPTQKPESLLERIILSSSNEGDVVLDPFAGCGTAVAVAERLNRRWIGIDVTCLATTVIKARLNDMTGGKAVYKVVGEPVSVPDAETLAASDPYQFQWWAAGLVGARPVEEKKGADKGIDGRLYFHDEGEGGKTKQVIVSVKAGKLMPNHVRDLRGVIDREKAEIGLLITMNPPTQPMRTEAASAGVYHSPGWDKDYPRLQILTVAELLDGRKIEMPPLGQVNVTFKKAPRAKGKKGIQPEMGL